VDVDTTKCGFLSTPTYVSSIAGQSWHWLSSGSSELYTESASGFKVCILLENGVTPLQANEWRWHMNWIAYPSAARERTDGTACAGETPRGSTNWVDCGHQCVSVDIDTSLCGFSDTPVFISSMGGTTTHWESSGSSELYEVSATGFKIHAHWSGITTRRANRMGWHINWIAHPLGHQVHTGGISCAGRTARGSTKWVQENPKGVYVDVDTSTCAFSSTPTYVTSLAGSSGHWKSQGSSEVYSPTASGFRIYISFWTEITPSKANEWEWHINWIADQA